MKRLCARCGNTIIPWDLNGVDRSYCPGKRCTEIRRRAEKQAREDERRIAAKEQDLADYTAALIDLQAKRARDELR